MKLFGVKMDKTKLSLFARIFGKKYFIRIVEDMKDDEILIIGRKIYISKKE